MIRIYSVKLLPVVCLAFSLTASAADLAITVEPFKRTPERGTVMAVFATVTNSADFDVNEVVVSAELRYETKKVLAGYSDGPWSCRDAGTLQKVKCVAKSLPAKSSTPLVFFVDPAVEGYFEIWLASTWRRPSTEQASAFQIERGTLYRPLTVTTTDDDGEGSLRQLILRANEESQRDGAPIEINFDTAGTIALATPLPEITVGNFLIDGRSRITLDGSQTDGHGLLLGGIGPATIRGLRIVHFPGDGIRIGRDWSFSIIENNDVEANGERGIRILPRANGFEIRGNRIASNARAGLFLESGYDWLVEDNEIRDNGASGVYLANGMYQGELRRNRISGNREAGIAVATRANLCRITENSVSRNNIGIDRGLDGFSGYDYDDYDLYNAKIPPPRITSATYDVAANATTIEGDYFDGQDYWGKWDIELFSNDVAEAQGKTFLGETSAVKNRFTLTVPGDLRGLYLTATGNRYLNLGWSGEWGWTSEFGEVFEVK